MFEKFFDKKYEKSNKLSFTFKVANKNSMLKKRLATMNNAEHKYESKKSKKNKLEKGGEIIPESFLLLMDELCLYRKDASKFYENADHWAYVKSDRKIFCTKRGNKIKFCNHKL
jgi:hypothetical protein